MGSSRTENEPSTEDISDQDDAGKGGFIMSDDKRIVYMLNVIEKMKSISITDIVNQLSNSVSQEVIIAFLDSENTNTVLYVWGGRQKGDVIEIGNSPPDNPTDHGRMLFFRKSYKASPHTPPEFYIKFGLMSNNPINDAYQFVNQVLLETIERRESIKHWPEIAIWDCTQQIHQLRSNLGIVMQRLNGTLNLPSPTDIKERVPQCDPNSLCGESLRSEIELCLDEWEHQINSIVDRNISKVRTEQGESNFFTPIDELNFWKDRKSQLEAIYKKINTVETVTMMHYLEKSESTQVLRFTSFIEILRDAGDEAEDAVKLLSIFEPVISKIENAKTWDEFKFEMQRIFVMLQLLWEHSVYYKGHDHFSILLTNTSDFLMMELCTRINSGGILKKAEREEAISEVDTAISVCERFDELYKSSCKEVAEREALRRSKATWSFAYSEVFSRWISFQKKLQTIKKIISTTIQYERFADISSVKPFNDGLRSVILSVVESYSASITSLLASGDPLSPDNKEFMEKFLEYEDKVQLVDFMVSIMIREAYQFCSNVEEQANFINEFWMIIQRPVICTSMKHLISEFAENLVKASSAKLSKFLEELRLSNIPQFIDTPFMLDISLIRSGYDYIERTRTTLSNLENSVVPNSSRQQIYKNLCDFNQQLLITEDELLTDWNNDIRNLCELLPMMPILRKVYNANQCIAINIPDTYYQRLLEIQFQCPSSNHLLSSEHTTELINRSESINELASLLSDIITLHDKVRRDVETAEYCLIESPWLEFNEFLQHGSVDVLWCDAAMVTQATADSLSSMQTITNNVYKMREKIDQAFNVSTSLLKPIISNTSGNSLDILSNEKRKTILTHFAAIGQWADRVERELEEIHADFSTVSQESWNAYTSRIDMKILHRLYEIVKLNAQSLFDSILEKRPDRTVVTARLKLDNDEIRTVPSLDMDDPDGMFDKLKLLIDEIIYQSGILKRIIVDDVSGSYQKVIEDCQEINPLRNKILSEAQIGIMEAQTTISKFKVYAPLWKNKREDYLKQFLLFSNVIGERDLQAIAAETEDLDRHINSPSLADIQSKIDRYNLLLEKIDKLPSSIVVQSWLKIEMEDFRNTIRDLCLRWIEMFLNKLTSFVINSLQAMNDLVESSHSVFESKIVAGDQEVLIKISQHMKDFTQKERETEALFEPVTQVMNALKNYDRDIDDETKEKFMKIHDEWASLQIKAAHVKQQLTPYLADQISSLRLRIAELDQWQDKFRTSFLTYGPFHQDISDHFERIDTLKDTLDTKTKEIEELREITTVFDMTMPEFKLLNQCKEDLQNIQQLWNLCDLITSSMSQWRSTTWKEANIELIEQTLKQKFLLKDLRAMNKACGKWGNFTRIESEVKNMLSAIRVISELKTDSMRERHWNELMESTTGFYFRIDDSMKLDDLLRLNLHSYDDQVRDIVEKSVKEMSMEKVLNEISNLWTNAKFDVITHERTGTPLMVVRDDIIEALDDHQNQLQMMSTSKYADHFANELLHWQTRLAAVDQVLRKLIDVQKTWSYLETIFMGSQDIRSKLPKETKQFHILDADFKNICKSNTDDLNIVRCLNRPMLLDLFESIERRLAHSQKALEGYLETKRIMFPRFYFVSPSELLDILSNGTDPRKVMHLLIKLFDSIDRLELVDAAEKLEVVVEQEKKHKSIKGKSTKHRAAPQSNDTAAERKDQITKHKRHKSSTRSGKQSKARNANRFIPSKHEHRRSSQTGTSGISAGTNNDGVIANMREGDVFDDDDDDLFDDEDLSTEDSLSLIMEDLTQEERKSVITSGMHSDEGEFVKFAENYTLERGHSAMLQITQQSPSVYAIEGQVENWVNTVLIAMKSSIRHWLKEAVNSYEQQSRETWVLNFPAQIVLTGSQIWWTSQVNSVFSSIETNPNALKEYLKKQMMQLNSLIKLLLGDLNELDRQKITTLSLLDLHARDIVEKMINSKVDNAADFMWQSQLRLRWNDQQDHCYADLCDATFLYQYEYLGNKSRLVITPLTDRCYITLTQSLHLYMGGAPAGPAGTGKTETTKDLGRTLGVRVVVSNCSEQMDYSSLGNLFKGLAQSGLWGCFDEFNRITADVLSVVSIQVKTILYALRSKKERFDFMGTDIALNPSVGIFITMNPGYAGRTELPENIKALFRPCAMIVPDFDLITELNLVSAGFTEAKLLARKFVTLYSLCRDLLSKQDHYDWGLRAIKSVLVVAGNLRRADPDLAENMVLMRALRDFNIPKITNDDLPVFLGLIQDLFPALDIPRKQDDNLETFIKKAASELKLQCNDLGTSNFVLKVVQLKELLEVRHSVFIVGDAGSGKSCVWKTLQHAHRLMSQRPIAIDLNPKAVTNDELFGVVNKTTREWRDGLLSSTMRQLARLKHSGPKWIVLDGDIDPMWIESLNTVMDDNKVLTLASNERIPLTKTMRLLFEIYHLRTATPATVSRAGILYINSNDIGYVPLFQSWLEKRQNTVERQHLQTFFDKYVPQTLECLRERCRKAIPMVDVSHINSLCILLNCLLTTDRVPPGSSREWYQMNFEFAWIWASAGCLAHDQYGDHRYIFSKWWVTEYKQPLCENEGSTIFDYYVDANSQSYQLWNTILPDFTFEPTMPLSSQLVPTVENERIRYWFSQLVDKAHPVMIVGSAGTGKTLFAKKCLTALSLEHYSVTNISLNYATDCEMFQNQLERKLERKAGKTFAPIGSKKMVFFIDDLNMPHVDNYETVLAHTILRQHLDYGHWYDRQKLLLKEVKNCQYVVCMNQNAGNFYVSPRLQRHFITFAMSFPSKESLNIILTAILAGHLIHRRESEFQFSREVKDFIPQFVEGSINIHTRIANMFLPTAIKFHYLFNMRELQRIYEGILFGNNECIQKPDNLIRLYTHEAYRTYSDKMMNEDDVLVMDKLLKDLIYKEMKPKDVSNIFAPPLVYSHYASGQAMPTYLPVKDTESLQAFSLQTLKAYNDSNSPPMNLVLFEDALTHLCRVSRILETPNGNALLVGVGGSGKQSVARLAAQMSSMDTFKVDLRSYATPADLLQQLNGIYRRTGTKSLTAMLLVSGAEDADDRYMSILNDVLSSGDVSDMFSEEESYEIVNSLKTEMKVSGMEIDRNSAWAFFIAKVKTNLKVVLTFSPVGNVLRRKARCYPALINATTIDWFHKWPKEALISVAERALQNAPHITHALVPRIAKFMSEAHDFVDRISKSFIASTSRYYYTTPKTFLEFVSLYTSLSHDKTQKINEDIARLRSGLAKLESVSEQTTVLKGELAEKEVIVNARTQKADAVLKVVTSEAEKVAKQKAAADVENVKLETIKNEVQRNQAACAEDLEKVKPALLQAAAALETLTKENLSELKSFNSPPDMVQKVMECVIILLTAKTGKIPKDLSWKAAKQVIGQVTDFLKMLHNYDKDNIPVATANHVKTLLKTSNLDPELIKQKSFAAAGICAWIVNIIKYHEVFQDILPKKLALDKADAELKEAKTAYDVMMAKVKELEAKLEEKNQEMRARLSEKDEAVKNKLKTAKSIELANRLVLGLGSSKVIWEKRTKELKQDLDTLVGDMLMTSAFLTYLGYFSMPYRDALIEKWTGLLQAEEPMIPYRVDKTPLQQMVDDADIAGWVNQGLPNDEMSYQNAAILLNIERCALIVDPQLQGTRWLHRRFADKLVTTKLDNRSMNEAVPEAVSRGYVLLVQNVGEQIGSNLEPLIDTSQIRKSKKVKWNRQELTVHPNFRVIIQSKLVNPHYKPETQAMLTLINFSVTHQGLESQLLASVVASEMPALERSKYETTMVINQNKISLKKLESSLLTMLANAEGNFIQNIELVETLETNVNTAKDIELKTLEATTFNEEIDKSREVYRPTAVRGRMMFFIMDSLYKVHPMYQFNLKAFKAVFDRGVTKADTDDDTQQRVSNIVKSVTLALFQYTSPGLFEEHKLIFTSQIALQASVIDKEVKDDQELDFLLKFAVEEQKSPFTFLTDRSYGAVKALSRLRYFSGIDIDIEANSRKWKVFIEAESPEGIRLHGEWNNLNDIQRLCVIRSLRPDRMIYAMRLFIQQKLGKEFIQSISKDMNAIISESSASTPVFFILSPGVDPISELEMFAKSFGYSSDRGNFTNVSLGQGQEAVAEAMLLAAAKHGHWVILQNIHLVPHWLYQLEKLIDQFGEKASKQYRLFMTAEPAPDVASHVIPQGILEVSLKITNEPPTGMNANLHKALDTLSQEQLDSSDKEVEYKTILFALCYFHAAITQRTKFGAIGWNRSYPFGTGDLSICSSILLNYLEQSPKIPWADLRYLFGEIMYGGHITDDWDRRLCKCYLDTYLSAQLVEGEFWLAPGFQVPSSSMDLVGFHEYVSAALPEESPKLYGLHPNAEIEFLHKTSERVFMKVLELQQKEAKADMLALDVVPVDRDEEIKSKIEDILANLPDDFSMSDITLKMNDASPYMVVASQECERMNILLNEIRRSLNELSAGLRGELSISSQMEELQQSLFINVVPTNWASRAYPSQHALGQWISDLLERQKDLDIWISRFAVPDSVWFGGLFNPQSFLTAIMQTTARRNEWSLDRMAITMEVTSKKNKLDGIQFLPKDAIQVHGVYLDGASWDRVQSRLAPSIAMELSHLMPPIFLRAIQADRVDGQGQYECPMYKTKQRGPTYVWKFNLKTKEQASKWILAGVAMLLQN